MKRLFIAIPVPDDIKREIIIKQNQLTEVYGRKGRTHSASLHLTLKFLGETDLSKMNKSIEVLREIALNFQAFDLQLSKVSSFPTPEKPRIIFAGLEPVDKISILVQKIDAGLKDLFVQEKRAFKPHITIFRPKIQTPLKETNFPEQYRFDVNRFELIESVLKPDRAYYHSIETFNLLK